VDRSVPIPDWLDELAFKAGPPYLEMGTRVLRPEAWLVTDEWRDEQLALKRHVLAAHRRFVSARLDGMEDASREVLELVEAWLAEHAPTVGAPDPADAGRPALEQAALRVQEDLTVLRREAEHWILGDLVVCFPSFWLPSSKLGLPIVEIHDPVPHYATELAMRVDRFLDRLTPDRPAVRRNWGVSATSDLYAPADPAVPGYPTYPDEVDVPRAGEAPALWIRSERETLRRLPRTGAILFTIRVQMAPVSVLADRPDTAAAMAASVRSWDPASAGYRSTGAVGEALLAWLDHVVARA